MKKNNLASNSKTDNWETVEYKNHPSDWPDPKDLVVVEDFLPSPEVLAKAEAVEKVTLALSADSLDWFRKTAKSKGIPYQRMIRKVLQNYSESQKEKTQRAKALKTN